MYQAKVPYEGTLFIYENGDGSCGYRILNRLSLECFTRSLDVEDDLMETEGYVIHRCDENEIWGFWIWDGEDRQKIYAAMKNAARRTELLGQGGTQRLGLRGRSYASVTSTPVSSWVPS